MVQMSNVVTKLAELTEKGQIPWKATADQSAFAATFGKLSVLITTESIVRFRVYRLAILDEHGREIDFASYNTNSSDTRYPQLQSLYDTAKHLALGVDKRLEELMEAMDLIAES